MRGKRVLFSTGTDEHGLKVASMTATLCDQSPSLTCARGTLHGDSGVCVCGVCLWAQVQEAAAAAGMEPGDFCDAISQRFRDAFEAFAIEPTDFVRTTEPRHHKVHERQQSCVAAPPWFTRRDRSPNNRPPQHCGNISVNVAT